ncbi:MAG: hypothetical protein WA891_19395 [Acidobacteriaceae bacterium]|jgi:hypothetical protein
MPQQIPPAHSSANRGLSRRKRLVIELSIGVAILALIPIGVSVQMPLWLQLIGWAVFLVCIVGQSVLMMRWLKQRRARRRDREAGRLHP